MELAAALGILKVIAELVKLYKDTVKPALDQSAEMTPGQRAELTRMEEEAFKSDYWQPEEE